MANISHNPGFLPNEPFTASGSVGLGESTDLFVKLAYTVPFAASSADSFITTKISKDLILGFEPTYFQVPYIYSAADNLVNGKYTSSSKNEGELIVTEYVIPYQGEFKEEVVVITTYFNTTTNILFYEIPRVFTYNSKDQASVAVTPNGPNFVGKLAIPSSFTTIVNDKDPVLYFNIDIPATPFGGGNSFAVIKVTDVAHL